MPDIDDGDEQRAAAGRPCGIGLLAWFLVACVVRTLPATTQARYLEEFSAELIDLSPGRQTVHALGLLGSSRSLARDLGPASVASHRRLTALAPATAVAAVLAIVFAGAGLAAREARPGDTLWSLTKVLYPDHARSVEGAAAVRSNLREAEDALANGRIAESKSMLDEARNALPTVASEDGKNDLQIRHSALLAKLPDVSILWAW